MINETFTICGKTFPISDIDSIFDFICKTRSYSDFDLFRKLGDSLFKRYTLYTSKYFPDTKHGREDFQKMGIRIVEFLISRESEKAQFTYGTDSSGFLKMIPVKRDFRVFDPYIPFIYEKDGKKGFVWIMGHSDKKKLSLLDSKIREIQLDLDKPYNEGLKSLFQENIALLALNEKKVKNPHSKSKNTLSARKQAENSLRNSVKPILPFDKSRWIATNVTDKSILNGSF
jgi:hypothetical protein